MASVSMKNTCLKIFELSIYIYILSPEIAKYLSFPFFFEPLDDV